MHAQNLMKLIKANEEATNFYLAKWINHCGTYGCLVGNYVIDQYPYKNYIGKCLFDLALLDFNITIKECHWLFSTNDPAETSIGKRFFDYRLKTFRYFPKRNCSDKSAAINRVRKFLYYKLHKQELICDEKYGIKESARRTEGNHMIIEKTLASIK